jgi:hypothetical protein
MAAASYSTDLTLISDAESTTGWAELTGHTGGGAAAQEGDYEIQGTYCVSQSTGTQTGTAVGLQFDYGSNVSWATGDCVFAWQIFLAPGAIDSWANGGMRLGVGSSSGNMKYWKSMGNDFGAYPYGGWQNTAIDPTYTADYTEGTPVAGNYRVFASWPNIASAVSKGNPHGVDIIRKGRGKLIVTGGDVTNGYGTFPGMAAANDASSARWGLVQATRGSYLWKGMMALGQDATAVDFRDANRNVVIDDTPRTYAAFNRVEVRHASSRVDFTAISMTALGTLAKGQFEAIANATINLYACTFTDMDTFVLQSNTTVNGSTFRRCGQITQGGASITGCVVDKSTAAASILSNNPSAITNTAFTSDGSNHAIQITTAGTYSLTNLTYSGYAASNGSTGNECIYNNSGGAVTLNVSGGNTPTIRNGTGASTTVNSTVSVTWQANVSLSGAEIRVYDLDGAGGTDYGTELAGVESHSSTTYTYGGSQGNAVLLQVMKDGYEEFTQQFTIPANATTFDITLTADNNA